MPTVSVIIPARNCEAYVAEAIESILKQTFSDWEILIADDGSTDATRSIIDGYDDPRIRSFHNDRPMGVVYTRNKLLSQTRGDFIAWQDADDISMPMRLETLLKTFEKDPELGLCGSNSVRYYKVSGDKVASNYPLTNEEIWRIIEHRRQLPFTGPAHMVRRHALQDINGCRMFFESIGGEDIDFILRIIEKYKAANIPDILYVYRYTRGSVSRKRPSDKTYLKLYSEGLAFFLADQRKRDNGLDGLMEGGNKKELEQFIKELQCEFETDRSVIYRRSCRNKISNQDYAFALLDAFQALRSNPLVLANYSLFTRLGGSSVKALFRMMKRRFPHLSVTE